VLSKKVEKTGKFETSVSAFTHDKR